MTIKRVLEPNKATGLRNFAIHLCGKNIRLIERVGVPLSATGNTIFVPTVPDDQINEFRDVLFPGIWHESAHIKRSSMEWLKKMNEMRATGEMNGVEESLFRLMEDMRIEYHEKQANSVANAEFRNLGRWAVSKLKAKYDGKDCEELFGEKYDPLSDPNQYIFNISVGVYMKAHGVEIDFLPPEIKSMVDALWPESDRFLRTSDPWADGTSQSWKTGKRLAKKFFDHLMKKIKEQEEAEKEKQKGGENDNEEIGEESDEEGDGKFDEEFDEESDEEWGGGDSEDIDENSNSENGNGGQYDEGEDEDEQEGDESGDGSEESGQGKPARDSDGSSEDIQGGAGEGGGDNNGGTDEDDSLDDEDDEEEYDEDDGGLKVHTKTTEVEASIDGEPELSVEDGGGSEEVDIKVDENGAANITASLGGKGGEKVSWKDLKEKLETAGATDLYVEILTEASRSMEEILNEGSAKQHLPHPSLREGDKPVIATEHGLLRYNIEKGRISSEIKKLRRKMGFYIMSKKRTHFLGDREEGEVDPATIYSLRTGNKNVFQERVRARSLNTAITFLGDNSGSMHGEKVANVRRAFIALGEECTRLGIPFEQLAFTTQGGRLLGLTPQDLQIYNRFENVKHIIVKSFDEPFQKVKTRILYLTGFSNNVDHEAIYWAAQRLYPRKEQRKILFVLSDGLPNTVDTNHKLLEYELVMAVRKIIKSGIEVYGIGIHTDDVKKFYPEWTVIEENKDNIAEAIFKCFEKKISKHY